MSQVPNISASIAGGAVQPSSAVNARNADEQKAARFSQKMRQLAEDEAEKVEDSYEASDDKLTIDEEEQDAERDSRDPHAFDRDGSDDDGEERPRVDVTV